MLFFKSHFVAVFIAAFYVSNVYVILAQTELTQNISFSTGFEKNEGYSFGYLQSDPNWLINGFELPFVSSLGYENSFGLELGSDTSLSLDFVGTQPASIVWIDFYVKPVFSDADFLPADTASARTALTGFVKISGLGEIYVLHGNGFGGGVWLGTGYFVPLDNGISTDWLRMTYRINYDTQRWDLYLNNTLQIIDVGFIDSNTQTLSKFNITGSREGTTTLDKFETSFYNPLFSDADNDGISDAYEISQGLNTSVNDRMGDKDFDLLSNIDEFMANIDAGNPDTDGDGINDGVEFFNGANPLVSNIYKLVSIPFHEDFEEYVDTNIFDKWTTSGANVSIGTEDALTGSYALEIGKDSTATTLLDGSDYKVIWIDSYLKPTLSSEIPFLRNDSGVAFFFNKTGHPVVFDGFDGTGLGLWKSSAGLVSNSTSNDWERLTIKVNYEEQSYDFYWNGNRLWKGLGFAYKQPYLSRFEISETTTLDDLTISSTQPLHLDNDNDGLYNETEDSNSNGVKDIDEFDLEKADTDGDGFGDYAEFTGDYSSYILEERIYLDSSLSSYPIWHCSFEASEGFEQNNNLHGQQGWYSSYSGSRLKSLNNSGNTYLELSGETRTQELPIYASKYFSAEGLDHVWISFKAKLPNSLEPEIETVENLPAVLFLRRGSQLVAYDGRSSSWLRKKISDPEEWHKYTAFLDYNSNTWNLFIDGLLVHSNVGFANDSIESFESLRLRHLGNSPAIFDEFVLSIEEPDGLDSDGDGLMDKDERILGTNPLKVDTDGDQIDDYLEFSVGMNPLSADDAYEDLDGDGTSNIQEIILGRDFQVADENNDSYLDGTSFAGHVYVERWKIDEGTNRTFTSNSFIGTREADSIEITKILYSEVRQDFESPHTRQGVRVRGYLVPEVTGTYYFRLIGDRQAEFYLSPGESPFDKSLAATVNEPSPLTWFGRTGQESLPKELEAGRRYYFEILQSSPLTLKRNGLWGLSWSYNDLESFEVIQGPLLHSYAPLPEDLDDDGLRDSYEIAHGLNHYNAYGSQGEWGNPDGDLYWNKYEQFYDLNPSKPDEAIVPMQSELFGQDLTISENSENWALEAIGNASDARIYEVVDGDLLLSGRSSRFYLNRDNYIYAYKRVEGDFSITCRVNFEKLDDPLALAGILISKGFENNSSRYALLQGPDGRLHQMSRLIEGQKGSSLNEDIPFTQPQQWIRVERKNGFIRFLRSFDNEIWYLYSELNQQYDGVVNVGFALTSANIIQHEAVRFTDIGLSGQMLPDNYNDNATGAFFNNQDHDTGNPDQLAYTNNENPESSGNPEKWVEYQIINQADYEFLRGLWMPSGDGFWKLRDINGKVKIKFNLTHSGIYQMKLPVKHYYSVQINAKRRIDLHSYLNGQYVNTTQLVITTNGGVDTLNIQFPYLGAGDHEYILDFENVYRNRTIGIGELLLESPVFSEGDRSKWEVATVASTESVDLNLHRLNQDGSWEPSSYKPGSKVSISALDAQSEGIGLNRLTYFSFTSPVTIEGISKYRKFVSVDNQPVRNAETQAWFSEVFLENNNDTQIIDISLQNGGIISDVPIRWCAVDLLKGGEILLRKGDSLRLAVGDQATDEPVTIIVGDTTYATSGRNPIVHTFSQKGIYQVLGKQNGKLGSILVTVLDVASVEPIAMPRGRTREFIWKDEGKLNVGDLEIFLNERTTASYSARRVESVKNRSITIRMEGPKTSILGVIETEPFWVRENVEGYFYEEEIGENVTIATNNLICSQLPEDVRLHIEIFKAGVTFDDGSIERWITGEDLDAFGQYTFHLLKPSEVGGSVCHQVNIYQGDTYVSRR